MLARILCAWAAHARYSDNVRRPTWLKPRVYCFNQIPPSHCRSVLAYLAIFCDICQFIVASSSSINSLQTLKLCSGVFVTAWNFTLRKLHVGWRLCNNSSSLSRLPNFRIKTATSLRFSTPFSFFFFLLFLSLMCQKDNSVVLSISINGYAACSFHRRLSAFWSLHFESSAISNLTYSFTRSVTCKVQNDSCWKYVWGSLWKHSIPPGHPISCCWPCWWRLSLTFYI